MVEQKAATQGIRMSKRVEPVLVTKQETIFLLRAKPIVIEGVLVVVKIKYSEPRLNQHSGSIIRRFPRDWSRRIHSVNKVPRPNPPRNIYYHQIGHRIHECPFVEDNVRQGFVEHFQKLNPELAKAKDHGDFELEDMYHKRIRIPNRLK